MAAGVYFYRLSGAGVHVTRRMVLIDGQAGVPSAGLGGLGAVVEAEEETAPVYGLVVSGRGLVPYVDPAFRVEAGQAPVDLVVETLDSVPRAKAMAAGIWGDVDSNERVDFFDALLVALYSRNASIVMPNNGDISLGDVNADGRVDLTDAWLIAAYLNDPSDSTLPSGIGEPVGTAPASQAWKLYWADGGTVKIQRSNLDGSGVEDLVTTGLAAPSDIALDVSGGKLYWTEPFGNKIQRSNLDGVVVEDLVITGLDFPLGIALDVSGGKLYWTEPVKIRRSNLDGSGVEDLVTTGLESPLGIALDVSGGKLYWTDAGTAKIRRSNLDGSGVEDLVTIGLEAPWGIALDVSGGKLYWIDADKAKIQRSNLDGSGVEDLVTTGLNSPLGLALDVSGGKLYWTDSGTDKIQRSNLDGSGVEDLVTTGLEAPFGIALGYVPVEAGPDLSEIGKPLAPLDEQTFNSQMVGKSFHVETWFLDFVSAGRFSENGRLPGSYSYSNTGSNTGLLTLTYDGGQYGGGCTLQLTFASATTGALHFICDAGFEGQETWRISEIGTPLVPRVVPHSDIDTELVVIFIDFFEVGETRAYDFQIRPKTPQGSWINACNAFTNTAGRALIGPVTQGFGGLESGTVYEARYRYRNSSRCGEGTPGPWSEIGEGATSGRGTSLLRFPDGESATRSIPENIPAGINVGNPVSAVGGDTLSTLTYTISSPEALSFDIVPETGQIRTREGVTYDYESKKYYSVAVGVEDGAGNSDMIDVTIHIVNLVPFSGLPSNLNLRTNHSDERLTLKWDPLPNAQGHARVLGYQTEIRRGSSGPWTDRRTILGPNFTRTIYTELVNEIGYQVRVRPITAEGDSEWSTPVEGIPTADLAPKDPVEHFDRFGPQPVGSSDRNIRFLTPGRCRHTSGGQTLDADCQYQNTGPNTGRITLEFDDPSQGSCEVSLAYSSLTAGSFLDECFDAGVNTNVPFDQSFRLPRSAPRSEGDLDPPLDETDVPRAPRTQEEFDALVYGRDDFIPGLAFGRICVHCDGGGFDWGSGWASRIGLDSDGLKEFPGKYSYRNIGSSEGVLTFEGNDGNTYVFNLDFEPSGNVSVTTTDPNGDTVVWPGMHHLDSTLGAEPVLLPLPPYWSEAIAIETDFAPEDWGEELESVLFADLYEQLFSGESEGLTYLNTQRYEKIGRNRAVITIEFSGTGAAGDDDYEDLDDFQKSILGSTWTFDLTFTSDGSAKVTLTITKAGELPTVAERFVDFAGDGIDLDEFPDELTLPDDPPQASGEDVSGVEVAAAVSTPSIGADDVQSFLVSNAGAGYQPGDWLEPKDGSNQRMMVVGTGPPAAAKPLASSDAASPRLHQRILKMQSAISPHSSPAFSSALVPRAKRVSQSAYLTSSSTITQLSVVCMQGDRDIPTRGARYFSQPKTAQGAVQLCQQDCVLNETDNIQECVWNCEADAP